MKSSVKRSGHCIRQSACERDFACFSLSRVFWPTVEPTLPFCRHYKGVDRRIFESFRKVCILLARETEFVKRVVCKKTDLSSSPAFEDTIVSRQSCSCPKATKGLDLNPWNVVNQPDYDPSRLGRTL